MTQTSADFFIRLSCIGTSNAEPMLIRFLSGLEKEIDVMCHALDLPDKPGLGGGPTLWKSKTRLLIEACPTEEQQEESGFEIFSDIDITVHRPFVDRLPALMDGYDILFQREWLWDNSRANIGFIIFRRTVAVRTFWEEILHRVERDNVWDQEAVNILLGDEDFLEKNKIKTGLLPEEFWCFSMGGLPGSPCILHHANCATSMAKKWLQMTMYQSLFSPSSRPHQEAFEAISGRLTCRLWSCGELGRRNLLGRFSVSENGRVQAHDGKIDFQHVTVTEDRLVLHREGEKLMSVLDEFYIDAHRGRMLCVGRLCPENFFSARQRNGFFFMHAPL